MANANYEFSFGLGYCICQHISDLSCLLPYQNWVRTWEKIFWISRLNSHDCIKLLYKLDSSSLWGRRWAKEESHISVTDHLFIPVHICTHSYISIHIRTCTDLSICCGRRQKRRSRGDSLSVSEFFHCCFLLAHEFSSLPSWLTSVSYRSSSTFFVLSEEKYDHMRSTWGGEGIYMRGFTGWKFTWSFLWKNVQ